MYPSPAQPRSESPSGNSERPNHALTELALSSSAAAGNPEPDDLGWCIRHRWRVIYYAYRHAANLPLWSGALAFERLMAGILCQLSRGFEPIEPIRLPQPTRPEDQPFDGRSERFQQSSCRIFPTPHFERRGWDD
jgi:hypothetical protein